MLIEAMTGISIPQEIFDRELYNAFKITGGLNNDWDHTYALIMFILSQLPAENLVNLNQLAENSLNFTSPKDRLEFIAGKVKASIAYQGLHEKLTNFASTLDETGVVKVDKLLLSKVGEPIKKTLKVWGEVGDSIISTIFEEMYAGAKLYSKLYGIKPYFIKENKGMIESSKVIILNQTLDELERILGGSRFGIASGSPKGTAKYALKKIIERFPEEGQYWYDTITQDEKRFKLKNLRKPNPYSLVKASEPFNPEKVLYIGDTIADYLTAENAGKEFIFAGVYKTALNSEETKNSFQEKGSSIITPTVNEIPKILRYARCEEI
jgi:phosphoglycolate phosphatase-like HAD superfamily hydrolase